jgi:hypothetical protein
MALFRRTPSTEPSSSGSSPKKLPKTMPSRFADGDPRAAGHETDYQASRGRWARSDKPTPGKRK